ncbi:MAG: hypothetical protein WBG50_07645 [Desulfomonilaceae bacterium]
MNQTIGLDPPIRIGELVAHGKRGATITCHTAFEINEVDFTHTSYEYRAILFFCRFSGKVDGAEYSFRKCYAKGCPHNLCPHVSQAVMIANRYLQKDYRALKEAGILIETKLFSLNDMVVKFQDFKDTQGPILTLEDYIHIAKEGNDVSMQINLEFLAAVENFGNRKERRTFLVGNFDVMSLGATHECQWCLTCYATDNEAEEKPRQARIANDRLAKLFTEFDEVGITCEKRFFA